ncbi:MAG TPA: phosphoglycerate kinase [Bdellovibrionota bacterium]|nr:phosphoglycerate kinase [Bdellovibrionota bacterium]
MSENLNPFRFYAGGERIKRLVDLDLAGKRVFLRADFNVPLKDGKITDDTRIRSVVPTIEYLRAKGAKVICASHLGRPNGEVNEAFTLEPVAARLGELLGIDVLFADDSVGIAVVREAKELKPGGVMVLQNLRFHPEEEANSENYATQLSQVADFYVNDAFGASHRAHASIDALPRVMKNRAAGLLLEKEVEALTQIINNPQRPMMSILGGSKVSDKVKVIDALMVKSSKIFIGGAMAYTFLRALDVKVGSSRVEADKITLARKILERASTAKCQIILPVDHLTGASFDNPGTPKVTQNAHILDNAMALDIGPKTIELFTRELAGAETIFWNGPMGVFEKPGFDVGTNAIAEFIAKSAAKVKVVGGGDSVAAVKKAGLEAGFTHVSTGGGASLEMIEGAPMPGLEALKRKD